MASGPVSPYCYTYPGAQVESSGARVNEQFYFENIVFQVESQLFKVPTYHFIEESQVFRDMFSLPRPEGREVEGSNKDHPLILEGVLARDFLSLLKVMFPQPLSKVDLVLDEWEGVIKLTDMWGMARTKERAATELDTLLSGDPATRIAFGRRYKLYEWLPQAYDEIIRRIKPISLKELGVLGPGTALKICELREQCCVDCSDREFNYGEGGYFPLKGRAREIGYLRPIQTGTWGYTSIWMKLDLRGIPPLYRLIWS